MRRYRQFALPVVLAALALLAIRVLPSVFAVTTANVRFPGSIQVGGSAFISCSGPATLNPAALTQRGNQVKTGTYTVTCTNRMDFAIDVSLVNRSLSPSGGIRPATSWDTTTINIPAQSSGSATLTATADRDTTKQSYSYRFTASVAGSDTEVDYSRDMSFTFTVD
ncbi:MAG TPA: hypothetical protein VD902_18055 [Symbiobacteriaceae bacterium]|nr:hypothetical protein [Symbiobacteriaceae bacterium]